jgi:arsenate reductase (thioredoxin)
MKKRVLFLCTGNSCRSQMAEGLGKSLWNQKIEWYSAGIEKHGLNPLAVKAMEEIGIDISHHHSKTLDDLKEISFDLVITVCSNANQTCPIFPGNTKTIHKGFDDPPLLARDCSTEEEAIIHYRRVRDQIKSFIENLDQYL